MIEEAYFTGSHNLERCLGYTGCILQDGHSKTGEPLRVRMHAWGSPATCQKLLLALAPFVCICVVVRDEKQGELFCGEKQGELFCGVYLI